MENGNLKQYIGPETMENKCSCLFTENKLGNDVKADVTEHHQI